MSEIHFEDRRRRAGITVREMAIDDLPRVFHLGERLFTRDAPNLYRNWDEYEVLGTYYDDAEYCFVAEQDGEVVGFVLGTTIEKPRSAWKYGYLTWMGVDPEIQGQGIGERLFARFTETMLEEGVRMILMDTEANNVAALSFFGKQGFGRPENHVYLSLNLSRQQRELKAKTNGGISARPLKSAP